MEVASSSLVIRSKICALHFFKVQRFFAKDFLMSADIICAVVYIGGDFVDISTIGTVNSYVKSYESGKKVCNYFENVKQKNTDRAEFSSRNSTDAEKEEKKSFSEMLNEQTERIRKMFGDTEEERDRAKLSSLRFKIYNGKNLTPEEEAYLEKKDPNSYSNYCQNKLAAKMYRAMLKNCRTRDQVNAMRLSNALSALSEFRKSAKNGGQSPVAGMNAAMERELKDFVRSPDFKRLPSDAECGKFDRDLAKAKKFEREKLAAKRREIIEKRRKSRNKSKKAEKTPGDGKQTVAQVMASPTARKVLASRRRNTGTTSPEGVSYIYKMNLKV